MRSFFIWTCLLQVGRVFAFQGSMLMTHSGGRIKPTALNSIADAEPTERREVLSLSLAALLLAAGAPEAALAAQSDANRSTMESIGQQTPKGRPKPGLNFPDGDFSTLPSGVKVLEVKEGSGAAVGSGSKVFLQLTGRLINLNGNRFFSTLENVKDPLAGPEPLIATVGKQQLVPGLEEGIIGMKKGGIRRIVVPGSAGYVLGANMEPQPRTQLEKNTLNAVLKNPRRDQSIMFDVKVERVK